MSSKTDKKSTMYRGYVELLILKLLSKKDSYGYELVKDIDELTKGKVSLSLGTIYPTLYKLIDNKYIIDYEKITGEKMVKVYYHLEDKGLERLEYLINEYEYLKQMIDNILTM